MDRIDLGILRLLQQRTSLSRRIGDAKRRHRAVIYVPERERELLRRVARLGRGRPSSRAVTAIFREILSSSRAEQKQPPIGLLRDAAPTIRAAARGHFGACDEFRAVPAWPELARGLARGSLAVALLTGGDLLKILASPAGRRRFVAGMRVTGELSSGGSDAPLKERIFVVAPRGPGSTGKGDRLLILIECKPAANALKRQPMPERPFHLEQAARPSGGAGTLARLVFARPVTPLQAATLLEKAGAASSVLGLYQGSEEYGG